MPKQKKYAIYIVRQASTTLDQIATAPDKKSAIIKAAPEAIPASYHNGQCGTIGDHAVKAVRYPS